MEKVRYMISDAANIVNVESHVLRYWEDELELNVPRNELGHRYYTKENIQEFQRIKELKEQGYQLKAIRMIVHNMSPDAPMDEMAPGMVNPPDLRQIPPTPPTPQTLPSGQMAQNGQIPPTLPTLPSGQMPQAAQIPLTPQTVSGGQMAQMPQNVRENVPLPKTAAGDAVLPSAVPRSAPIREPQQSVLENTDKMAQFTELMTQIVGNAIAANNRDLSKCISDDVGEQVIKEMNYLIREQEEADEERFRKLDEALRGNLKKKESKRWRKKKM